MLPVNIPNNAPSLLGATVKATGKLSTRNSRLKRKRREHREKDSTTPKEKVPIPSFSFTPIRDESSDEDEERKGGRKVEVDGKINERADKKLKPSSSIENAEKCPTENIDKQLKLPRKNHTTTQVSSSRKAQNESGSASNKKTMPNDEKLGSIPTSRRKNDASESNDAQSVSNSSEKLDQTSTPIGKANIPNSTMHDQLPDDSCAVERNGSRILQTTNDNVHVEKTPIKTIINSASSSTGKSIRTKPSAVNSLSVVGNCDNDKVNATSLMPPPSRRDGKNNTPSIPSKSIHLSKQSKTIGSRSSSSLERDEHGKKPAPIDLKEATSVPDESSMQSQSVDSSLSYIESEGEHNIESTENCKSLKASPAENYNAVSTVQLTTPKIFHKTQSTSSAAPAEDSLLKPSSAEGSYKKLDPALEVNSASSGKSSQSLGLTRANAKTTLKKRKKYTRSNSRGDGRKDVTDEDTSAAVAISKTSYGVKSSAGNPRGDSIEKKLTDVTNVRSADQRDKKIAKESEDVQCLQRHRKSSTAPAAPSAATFLKSPHLGGLKKTHNPELGGNSGKIDQIDRGLSTPSHNECNQEPATTCNNESKRETKTSKYFGSIQSEVIEIDDDEVEEIGKVKPDKVDAKNGATASKKKRDNAANRKKASKSNSSKKETISLAIAPRVSKASESSSEESSSAANDVKKPTANKRRRQQTMAYSESQKPSKSKNKLCFACSSCKCHSRDGSAATPGKMTSVSNLSGSDARVEQSLVNRLRQLERNLEWTKGVRHSVARDLQKHRTAMLKKWESNGSGVEQPRFLPDAEVSEEWGDVLSKRKVGDREVDRARSTIFGKNKNAQPTLTQGFGFKGCKRIDGDGCKGSDDCDSHTDPVKTLFNIETIEEESDNTSICESVDENISSVGDFLSCWSSPEKRRDTSHHFGSMDDLKDAASRFQEKQPKDCSTTLFGETKLWANATAKSIRTNHSMTPQRDACNAKYSQDTDILAGGDKSCNGDDGLGALIALFDESISNENTEDFIESTQKGDQGEAAEPVFQANPNLTPRGMKVIEGIEADLIKDERKLQAIESSCPEWKENVMFAQLQTDPEEVESALLQVQQARASLEKMKEKVLQAFFERESTLPVME